MVYIYNDYNRDRWVINFIPNAIYIIDQINMKLFKIWFSIVYKMFVKSLHK